MLSPDALSKAMIICAVVERLARRLAPAPKKRRSGYRVAIHVQGTAKMPEQLALALVLVAWETT